MKNNEIEKTSPSQSKVLTSTIPENNDLVKSDYDIDAFLEKRAEFIKKVKAIMVEGKDYHVIQNKKSLAKGGAEKIASIFGWTAVFDRDLLVSEAFREVPGLISFVCKLSKSGVVIGEGRGAALLNKNAGDPNKCIKMAQKSAFIDATLRASGLSDFFTQDLEDMPTAQISSPAQTPRYGQNLKPSEPLKVNTYQQEPQINLLGKDYDRYAEKIQSSTNLKELEAWGQNIKYLGKTLSNHEKDKLKVVYRERKNGLMAMEKGEIIIGEDTPQ